MAVLGCHGNEHETLGRTGSCSQGQLSTGIFSSVCSKLKAISNIEHTRLRTCMSIEMRKWLAIRIAGAGKKAGKVDARLILYRSPRVHIHKGEDLKGVSKSTTTNNT
jgi:hypothetical protein